MVIRSAYLVGMASCKKLDAIKTTPNYHLDCLPDSLPFVRCGILTSSTVKIITLDCRQLSLTLELDMMWADVLPISPVVRVTCRPKSKSSMRCT